MKDKSVLTGIISRIFEVALSVPREFTKILLSKEIWNSLSFCPELR